MRSRVRPLKFPTKALKESFMQRILALLPFFFLFLFACSKPPKLEELPEINSQARDEIFFSQVKPIMDRRCVTCHSCYTAPCQLNLADIEGLRRGASKTLVYDGSRLQSIEPTRLFYDAQNPLAWRDKGFFPVSSLRNPEDDAMSRLMELRRTHPLALKAKVEESHVCPDGASEVSSFVKDHPESGMPYGLPPLEESEQKILDLWMKDAYPSLSLKAREARMTPSPEEKLDVQRWEELLNRPDAKHQLVARYLYEHLYLAHLEFAESKEAFYRMVRSRTPSPKRIELIATTRPFDSPGEGPFYYRLQKITETMAHKNHIIYPLSEEKWRRLHELFYDADWTIDPKDLPSYEESIAANPFRAFQAIPVESRYRFLLDNALFFVSTFIKGTVCEGSTAVNVIDEKFFIFFAEPISRLNVANDTIMKGLIDEDLKLPSQGKNSYLSSFYPIYKNAQMNFVNMKQKIYKDLYPKGIRISDIWDGDGYNPEAVLTVFRHFDNAYVRVGALGATPKTSWVMDYPIFERMYYLLVAGFDVFGNAGHQSATRLYMDNLRIESEDLFLSFLPRKTRDEQRAFWYRGEIAQLKMKILNPYGGVIADSQVQYQSKDPKSELLRKIVQKHFSQTVRGRSNLDDCCGLSADDAAITNVLRPLTQARGHFVTELPDISLLHVVRQGKEKEDLLLSLIHHKEHLNISFMFVESTRLAQNEDRVMIQEGIHGSFPNYILRVKEEDLPAFVKATQGIEDKAGRELWKKAYGMSRYDSAFWDEFDTVQAMFDRQAGTAGGILDLSKYELW